MLLYTFTCSLHLRQHVLHLCLHMCVCVHVYHISANKRLPRINAGPVFTPGVQGSVNVINAGLKQMLGHWDEVGVANVCTVSIFRSRTYDRVVEKATLLQRTMMV